MVYYALLVILSCAAAAIGLSWIYFRRYQVTRPPIGVFNLRDVAFMITFIILVPYLYLALPSPVVAGLLLLGTGSVLYLVVEPVLRARAARWALTLGLLVADFGAAWVWGTASAVYLAVNNLVMVLMVIGISNLWAQSGMKARDVTLLGGALIVYDFTATAVLPLMGEVMARLAGLPLGPQVAWPAGAGPAFIGLGDLLLAAVFPLVMRKAFGRGAGLAALTVALATIAALFLLPISGLFPVMIVLGPLMIAQYLYWARRRGAERTTWQYRQAEA